MSLQQATNRRSIEEKKLSLEYKNLPNILRDDRVKAPKKKSAIILPMDKSNNEYKLIIGKFYQSDLRESIYGLQI